MHVNVCMYIKEYILYNSTIQRNNNTKTAQYTGKLSVLDDSTLLFMSHVNGLCRYSVVRRKVKCVEVGSVDGRVASLTLIQKIGVHVPSPTCN